MKIIISPAKKMVIDNDSIAVSRVPCFMEETEYLRNVIQSLSYQEAKELWNCNDKIASLNYERFQNMKLDTYLTPAILAYEGIQYQYMAPAVLDQTSWDYLEEHLRILSGFYGVLNPLDGVVPYRLEMQARFQKEPYNLYEFWRDKIARKVCEGTDVVINLASKEYSKCISRYLPENVSMIEIVFGELIGGKVKEKGTYAKMARGEMVRFMAEHQIECVEDMSTFDRLDYHFTEEYSDEHKMVFIR